ncbi:hypothetical protein Cgig2_018481 [Carnegiea gigantea]|uniref:KAT8 regulatory NSL complex subunit 2 n=1 Tax=Carnegiea gigantea TaxID=171969 RepID=A0A9Q1Q4W0_9CARY|nr:hypothetical protein Cgig2_018481 [Carnegiea gigantea]
MASSSKFGKELLSPPPPSDPHQLPTSTTTTTTKPLIKRTDAIARPQASLSTNTHGVDILSPSQEDTSLSKSSVLTKQELLRRRLHRLRQLSKVYKDHYWALMEDLRAQYREYYWKYGVSPYKEEDERESGGGAGERELAAGFNVEGCGETNNNGVSVVGGNGGGNGGGKLGLGFGESMSLPEVRLSGNNRCAFVGCKLKAMALTSFCHLHILSDPEQKLYKACNFVIKSSLTRKEKSEMEGAVDVSSAVLINFLYCAQAGPILCGKPILRSTIPSLCNIHFQKAQKHATRALKKAGLNVSSSSKLAPKFHVVIAEYVNQIQSKRRAARKANGENVVKEESTS